MADSILILGAGEMQEPAICAAKNLGLTVYAVDANENAPCVPLANYFEKIDLKESEQIARYALTLKQNAGLKGIFTAGTDFSESVCLAAEKCGLPGHSFFSAQNASNKALMRQCFKNARVPSPDFFVIPQKDAKKILTEDFIQNLKFPCVAKPVDNMGARGCRLVQNRDELFYAIDCAAEFSKTKSAILEEYMEGMEISIDALIYDGTLTITGFAERHIFFPPHFVEMGHTMPLVLPYEKFISVVKVFAQGIRSLGLSHGAAKGDIKLTPAGPMIGEIAARLSGGYMSGWTFPYSSSLNLTEQAILLSIGERPAVLEEGRYPTELSDPYETFVYGSHGASAERAWLSIPGKVQKILGEEEAKNTQNVRNVFVRANEGDEVFFPENNVQKCGNIISFAPTKKEAVFAAEEAAKKITLVLQKPHPRTEEFLWKKWSPAPVNFPPRAYQLPFHRVNEIIYELECNSNKKIPAGEKISRYVPQSLFGFMDLCDWNRISLKEAIEKFDGLCPHHAELAYKDFWTAFMRGGIQGALYYAQ